MDKPQWICPKCGSTHWVGWRAYAYTTRMAQCVTCGHVSPLPAGEPQ